MPAFLRNLAFVAACVGIATPRAHADLTRNLAEAYADTRAAMEAGAGSIVCIGDSLTFREGGFFPHFKPLMQDRYGNGGAGYLACSTATGVQLPPVQWSIGAINNDSSPHHALDGLWLAFSPGQSLGAARVLTPDATTRLFYAVQPQGGSFIVRYPGGAFSRVETSGAQGLGELTHTFAANLPPAQRFLQVEPLGNGPVLWLGQESISQAPGPRLHRAANGGWGVDEFLRRDATFDASLAALSPTLYIIMLGQNNGFMDRAVFAANMNLLVNRLQGETPAAEIVLVSSYDAGAYWNALHSLAMEDVAIARGVGFVNLFEAMGDHASCVANGYVDPDGVHFSPAGGALAAQIVFDALESAGRSLTPCRDLDFNNDGVFPDTADLDAALAVFAGEPCPALSCDPIDFNRDGVFPDTADLDALLRNFSGAEC